MMSNMDRTLLYLEAWEKFGAMAQLDMLIEEMAELTQAILKARRDGRWVSTEVVKEYVDVKICIEQLELKIGGEGLSQLVATTRDEKLERLDKLVNPRVQS